MPLLNNLANSLGLVSTEPLKIDASYQGEKTTEVLEVLLAHIRELEKDATCDKRLLAFVKMFVVIHFGTNPFT